MIFHKVMPAFHKASDEINVLGLQNLDAAAAKNTYNELIKSQSMIYKALIKPYAERLNVLEEEETQRNQIT